MLACWDCKNLSAFLQVSSRADARQLTQTASAGIQKGPWERSDARPPSVYCAQCGKEVDTSTLTDVDLADGRINFVAPSEFEVEDEAEEVTALRPDADWARFDMQEEPPSYAPLPDGLDPVLVGTLERTKRLPLYTHQADAIAAALEGSNVVQATSAGSGKSLGLVVPVLQACLQDPRTTAFLVYPLRALANDQLSGLAKMSLVPEPWVDDNAIDLLLAPEGTPIRVARYDGSFLEHQRKAVRASARIVVTTPDSLHASILRMATRVYSDRTSWSRIFQGLRFVVLDEVHSYQGVFGSAVAQVLRRVRRTAARYGARPQFLAASATIGNPAELAEKLTGAAPWELVDNDGSPRRRRTVLVCNPPLLSEPGRRDAPEGQPVDLDEGVRVAPQTMAIELIASAALASEKHPPVRTICFTRSRLEAFALTRRLQGRLKDLHAQQLVRSVAPYAATLLDSDRVSAEGKLRDGSTLAIVSTNALELGIDIPDLSIAVLCGFPGQIASFRQRAGRVGRTGDGLVVLVVADDPLQQFIATDAEALKSLLSGRPEEVVINPSASEIVRRFGLAPGQEDLGGVSYEDREWFGTEVTSWLDAAEGPPSTTHNGIDYWRVPWDQEAYPPLRNSTGGESYTVVCGPSRDPVGVIDAATAPRDAFVPAIWNGPDKSYRVVGFDHARHHIICEGPIEAPYLTRGIPVDQVEVRSELAPLRTTDGATAGYAVLGITRQVFSYKVINLGGGERTEQVDAPRWPPLQFLTEGMHLRLNPSWTAGLAWEPNEAVKGFEHVLLALSPVVVACDPYDIDATSDGTTVYLYDSFGGGIGITRVAFERLPEIISYGLRLVQNCACTNGCPSCVFLSRRPDGNRDVSKAGALNILMHLDAVLNGHGTEQDGDL